MTMHGFNGIQKSVQPWMRLVLLNGLLFFSLACHLGGVSNAPAVAKLPDGREVALSPVSMERARTMAHYTRRTLVDAGTPMPVSWSKVNTDCEKRMQLVQYVFTAGSDPTGRPLTLRPENFSESNLKRLAEEPAIDVKGLAIYGQLGATQTLLNYNGTIASPQAFDVGWDIHFITIVNIDGIAKVIDLSVGDEPLDLEGWLSGFAKAPFNYDPIDRFTALGRENPSHVPEDLSMASQAFLDDLKQTFGIQDPSLQDLPWFLTRYTAK